MKWFRALLTFWKSGEIVWLDMRYEKCLQGRDYEMALYYIQKSYEKTKAFYGNEHPEAVKRLLQLAQTYRQMRQYATTESLYQEALELVRQNFKLRGYGEGKILSDLASFYRETGKYEDAKLCYQQSLDIIQEALSANDPNLATVMDNLAQLYIETEDYAQAKSLCQRALEIRRNNFGEKHLDVANSLNTLGVLNANIGEYSAAASCYQQSLEIKRQILGDKHIDMVVSLNNLADLYREWGDYSKSEELLNEGLEIASDTVGEIHPITGLLLHNLGGLYDAMRKAGDWVILDKALDIRRRTLGEYHPDVAETLNLLGVTLSDVGNFAHAEPKFQEALNIRRNIFGEMHPSLAPILHNLSGIYRYTGELDKAISFDQEALNIMAETLDESHPHIMILLYDLAYLHIATNSIDQAQKLMREAQIVQTHVIGRVLSAGSERQRLTYLTHPNLGPYHRLSASISLILQHLAHKEQAKLWGANLILQRKAISAEILAAQNDRLLAERYPDLRLKLQKINKLRQRISRKQLAGPDIDEVQTFKNSLEVWKTQLEQLERELVQKIPELNISGLLQTIDTKKVTSSLPTRTVLVEFNRSEIYRFNYENAERVMRLKDGFKFVSGESFIAPTRYLAFILFANVPDQVSMIDLGEADRIDQLIADYRAKIVGDTKHRGLFYGDQEAYQATSEIELGQKLRATIFDPLLTALGDCRRLFLSPDGDLSRLPFEILPTDDGRRLIDDYQISYVNVGRDILRFGAGYTGEPTEPVVVADPDFDLAGEQEEQEQQPVLEGTPSNGRRSKDLDRAGLHFGRLPGTRTEGQKIAEMLDVSPVMADVALEKKLKSVQSPRILHIATHGFFLPDQKRDPNEEQLDFAPMRGMDGDWGRLSHAMENPLLRSGLALAGANTWLNHGTLPPDAEDGILTAEDVTGLDLLATELVVLSACETGLGEVQVGEGVFGLRRAFVLAGAKTLVMSLWKVPDQQTQELMTDFYRRILAGEPRAEALRQAQLTLKEKYPDPLYWGAFICQGEPGPLERMK